MLVSRPSVLGQPSGVLQAILPPTYTIAAPPPPPPPLPGRILIRRVAPGEARGGAAALVTKPKNLQRRYNHTTAPTMYCLSPKPLLGSLAAITAGNNGTHAIA